MTAAAIEPVRHIWWDEYTGTAEELIAAGLVCEHELPGQPGNGVMMMTFNADGERVSKGNSKGCGDAAGYRQIRKRSRQRFSICRSVGREESERRREADFSERRRREEVRRGWPFPVCMGAPC